MKTTLINQQKKHLIQENKLQQLTDFLSVQLEALMPNSSWSEVAIILTDDQGIIATNHEYFGKDRPTDVISFRYEPIPGEMNAFSGDLIVNVDRALQEGPNHEGTDYELALYIAHGFNHLSGAEDDTPYKRQTMRKTETAWLKKATENSVVEGLFTA